MVTKDNYEEYMMLDADGELNSADRQALQVFIAANPALQDEYASWQALKLQPDVTLTYPDKNELVKREAEGRVIGFRSIAVAAAAAVLALLFLLPAFFKQDVKHPLTAHHFQLPEPAVPVRDQYADSLLQKSAAAERRQSERGTKPGSTNRKQQGPTHRLAVSIPQADSMAVLDGAIAGGLSEKVSEAPLLQNNYSEALATENHEAPLVQSSRQALITWAPENRKAIELLKQAIESRVAQASAAAKAVRETALEIRVGHGSINLNF